jgi:hypothetical protein
MDAAAAETAHGRREDPRAAIGLELSVRKSHGFNE